MNNKVIGIVKAACGVGMILSGAGSIAITVVEAVKEKKEAKTKKK